MINFNGFGALLTTWLIKKNDKQIYHECILKKKKNPEPI